MPLPPNFGIYMSPLWILLILILSGAESQHWHRMDARTLLHQKGPGPRPLTALCALAALYIGLRPVYPGIMGDTWNYYNFYLHPQLSRDAIANPVLSEYLWSWTMILCGKIIPFSGFLIIVAAGYVFFPLLAFRLLMKNNAYGAILFFFGAFSFFSYATNGLRSGLSSSILLAVFALVLSGTTTRRQKTIRIAAAIILSYAAYSIHNTALIPLACFAAALLIRSTPAALAIWLLSIPLLFLTYPLVDTLIWRADPGIPLFSRLKYFVFLTDTQMSGTRSIFRPDFLAYSSIPIILWCVIRKKIRTIDPTYTILINTYILANALWILLMWIYPSNRIAYLSWFMYPLVIAYPLLRMDIWPLRQGAYAALALMLHTAFTAFMQYFYYAP